MTMATRADRFEAPLSWSAVLAGAAAALAITLVFTALAAGFGYSLAPGLASRESLAGFTPVVGAGAVAAQVLSAALGGYLAGRLRPAWSAHGDEAHFRDTAHGLLAWAVSTLAGVVLAACVLAPYAQAMGGPAAVAPASPDIAAQSSFFIGVGMLLSAFTAAVAGRLGGLRTEEMIARGEV
jgi:hypothetical protein